MDTDLEAMNCMHFLSEILGRQ